ncbi:alcohol dehydrogenase, partial [Aureobasidium melanogenum]
MNTYINARTQNNPLSWSTLPPWTGRTTSRIDHLLKGAILQSVLCFAGVDRGTRPIKRRTSRLAVRGNLENSSAWKLALLQELQEAVNILQSSLCEDGSDQASGREIKRFFHLLQSARHRSNDVESLQDKRQGRCSCNNCFVFGQADSYHGATRPKEVGSRPVCLSSSGKDDNTMGAISCKLHDLSSHVFAGKKVDIVLCTKLLAKLALLVSAVNSDDSHALCHQVNELQQCHFHHQRQAERSIGQVSQHFACKQYKPVKISVNSCLQLCLDIHTVLRKISMVDRIHRLADTTYTPPHRIGPASSSETPSGNLVAYRASVRHAISAEFTLLADTGNPFDTCSVSDIPQVLDVVMNRDDLSCSLVTSNAVGLRKHFYALRLPFIVNERFVTSTKTSPVDLDEDLTRAWLMDRYGLHRCARSCQTFIHLVYATPPRHPAPFVVVGIADIGHSDTGTRISRYRESSCITMRVMGTDHTPYGIRATRGQVGVAEI